MSKSLEAIQNLYKALEFGLHQSEPLPPAPPAPPKGWKGKSRHTYWRRLHARQQYVETGKFTYKMNAKGRRFLAYFEEFRKWAELPEIRKTRLVIEPLSATMTCVTFRDEPIKLGRLQGQS